MSFLDLPCEYLSVDALDILGSNRVNITGEWGINLVRSFGVVSCGLR